MLSVGELSGTIHLPWHAVQTKPEELKDIHPQLPQEVIDSELASRNDVITSEPQSMENRGPGAQSEVPSSDGVNGQGGGSYDRDALSRCCADQNCQCTQEDCEDCCEVSGWLYCAVTSSVAIAKFNSLPNFPAIRYLYKNTGSYNTLCHCAA